MSATTPALRVLEDTIFLVITILLFYSSNEYFKTRIKIGITDTKDLKA